MSSSQILPPLGNLKFWPHSLYAAGASLETDVVLDEPCCLNFIVGMIAKPLAIRKSPWHSASRMDIGRRIGGGASLPRTSRAAHLARSTEDPRTIARILVRRIAKEICIANPNASLEAEGIVEQNRAIVSVLIGIRTRFEPHGVFRDKTPRVRIVVTRSGELESSLAVDLAGSVLEGVRQRAGRGGLLAERVERVGLRQRPRCVAERRDGADTVRVIVASRGRTKHCQRLVDVHSLRIAGDYRA